MTAVSTSSTTDNTDLIADLSEADQIKVFAATKEDAGILSPQVAKMYEEALGKGGVQKEGHEAYPDSDLFSAQGVKETLEAGERLIGVAQMVEKGEKTIVGAMVADRLSPYHVEFNSMAVPVQKRGLRIGSHIVRGLSEIIEKAPFTVNCTELVTHSLASQAAHFHNGFNAICGFAFCHYPHVFFKNHPESVLWVTRLQGKLVPVMKSFRNAVGRGLGRHEADVKQKLIAAQASGQVSLTSGRLDEESLNLVAEILKERTAYVPKRYNELVQSILFQFEDILDRSVKSWVRTVAEISEEEQKSSIRQNEAPSIDLKEGFSHSYITYKNNFVFDEGLLAEAITQLKAQKKRYIKVCIPANTPEAIKAADYLIENDFVFHSYLPLYGFEQKAQAEGTAGGEGKTAAVSPQFFDILSMQWIEPTVLQKNALPGETESVVKLYGYPQNLSGPIVRTIARDLEKQKKTD